MLTWVEIKKSNIQYNLKQFRKIVGKRIKIMAIVKANAYGHGILDFAKIVCDSEVDYLGVVNLDEALYLKKSGIKIPVFILSFYELSSKKIEQALKQKIEFPIYTTEQIKFLSKIAKKINKQVNVHIKVDTGISRIGVFPEQIKDFITEIKKFSNLKINGMFTHYADSESKDQTYTSSQTKKFKNIVNEMDIPLIHAGCSASTINNSATFFNLVRIGIAMYGLWPSGSTKIFAKKKMKHFNLRPALSWKTSIIQVKTLPKGSFVGYDRTVQVKQRTIIAVLPVGYWDGYDRGLSNCGQVLIQGVKCSVIGNICMNITMVNVSKLKDVKAGDEVVLLGKQANQEIKAEDIASKINTINYEIITRINQSIPRIYV